MTLFEADLNRFTLVDGVKTQIGVLNLLLTIRDLRLWKIGLKPHCAWRLKDVKLYFNVSGNVDSMLEQLEVMKNEYKW